MSKESVLHKISESVRARLEERLGGSSAGNLFQQALNSRKPSGFVKALQASRPSIIAEIKFASPSQGQIEKTHDPVVVARDYLAADATALSILTEQDYFSGRHDYLRSVRAAFPDAKILMKDFVVDEKQIFEARICGADAALLIVALLGSDRLKALMKTAESIGIETLVEVHDEEEMKIAVASGAKLIGVNSRDLKTLQIKLETFSQLVGLAPASVTLVAESGIKEASQINELNRSGYSAFLIGTSLMATGQPGRALADLKRDVK